MNTIALLPNLSGWEILMIFLAILLLFGAKRLPEIARSFGKSIREFKSATTEIQEDIRTAMEEEPKKPTSAPKQVEAESTPKEDSDKA